MNPTLSALKAARASLEAGDFCAEYEDASRPRCGCFGFHLPTPVDGAFPLTAIADAIDDRFQRRIASPFHPATLRELKIDKRAALELLDAAIARAQ